MQVYNICTVDVSSVVDPAPNKHLMTNNVRTAKCCFAASLSKRSDHYNNENK